MLTTLEIARAEFGFYAATLRYNGEVQPLHGRTLHVALRCPANPIPGEWLLSSASSSLPCGTPSRRCDVAP